jgi:uncharacterized protein YjbJ (UPF0337 family)
MNSTQMKGNWIEMKGKLKERWGNLTDDDLKVSEGKMDELRGRIMQRYGLAKEDAQKQLDDFMKQY